MLIHGVAGNVEHAAHDAFADGHGDRRAGVRDLVAALQTFGAGHGDGADPVVAEVLLHFERQLDGLVLNFVFDGQRVVDAGQRFREIRRPPPDRPLERFCLCSYSYLI